MGYVADDLEERGDLDGPADSAACETAGSGGEHPAGMGGNCREQPSHDEDRQGDQGRYRKSAPVAAPAKWRARRFTPSRKYSSINPARSRIRVVTDEMNDEYVPVRAGNFTRDRVRWQASLPLQRQSNTVSAVSAGRPCPSRDFSSKPDSGLPLKCDMCEDAPRWRRAPVRHGVPARLPHLRRTTTGNGDSNEFLGRTGSDKYRTRIAAESARHRGGDRQLETAVRGRRHLDLSEGGCSNLPTQIRSADYLF